jgi:calcium-dependent protein kinase
VATNFICCLKVITKQGLTPQMKDQIAREILIQSYLSHPHIVAIYGHCHDEQNVFLLLEACLGGNLFQKLKATEGKGLPEKEVASTVKEACKALAYMHANDIIHRDIKP